MPSARVRLSTGVDLDPTHVGGPGSPVGADVERVQSIAFGLGQPRRRHGCIANGARWACRDGDDYLGGSAKLARARLVVEGVGRSSGCVSRGSEANLVALNCCLAAIGGRLRLDGEVRKCGQMHGVIGQHVNQHRTLGWHRSCIGNGFTAPVQCRCSIATFEKQSGAFGSGQTTVSFQVQEDEQVNVHELNRCWHQASELIVIQVEHPDRRCV